VKTAVVKYAKDNFSARCLGLKAAGDRIRDAARSAIAEHDMLQPYRIGPPYTINVTLREAAQAGAVAGLPGVTRDSPVSVGFSGENFRELYAMLEAVGIIAGTVR
jgi:D-aminopeptidase